MTQIYHSWGYAKDSKLTHCRNSCTSVFTEAQLPIAKLWNQPKCLSVEEWTQNEAGHFFREMDATGNNPNKPIEPHIFVLKFQPKTIRLKRNGQRVQRENSPRKTSRELVDRLRNSPLPMPHGTAVRTRIRHFCAPLWESQSTDHSCRDEDFSLLVEMPNGAATLEDGLTIFQRSVSSFRFAQCCSQCLH